MTFILALAGVLTIFGVIWTLRQPEAESISVHFRCDAVSPDGVYRCLGSMGHSGWCNNGDIEWRWEAWAVGCDDDTRSARPAIEPTMDAPVLTSGRRIPRRVFWLGVLVVAWVAIYGYGSHSQQTPQTRMTCDWQVTKCVDWRPQM